MWDPFGYYAINDNLNAIANTLNIIQGSIKQMVLDLGKITASVAAVQGAEASAEALLVALTAALKAIPPSTDPATQASLDALAAQLDTGTADLSAAVAANPVPVA